MAELPKVPQTECTASPAPQIPCLLHPSLDGWQNSQKVPPYQSVSGFLIRSSGAVLTLLIGQGNVNSSGSRLFPPVQPLDKIARCTSPCEVVIVAHSPGVEGG